jgi:hypothetical protein
LNTTKLTRLLVQFKRVGWKYVTSIWNAWDIFAGVLAIIALRQVEYKETCVHRTRFQFECMCTAHAWQAVALLLSWSKILYFLRGFEYFGFVVNMVKQIIVDMANFLVVLGIILFA